MKPSLFALSALLLAGVASGSGADSEEPAPSAAPSRPVEFPELLEIARHDNSDIRIAAQRVQAAQGQWRQAGAAFWPRVHLDSSYAWTDEPTPAFGALLNQRQFDPRLDFNRLPATDDLRVAGGISIPLYAGGQNRARREAADARRSASAYAAAAVEDAVEFEVARGYFTLLKTRDFIRAAEASVRAFEASQSIASRRFESGTILRSELLDVEVQLATALENRVRTRNAHTLARRAFHNLLGWEGAPLELSEIPPALIAPPADAAPIRAELAAAQQRILAADSQVREVRGKFLPRADAFSSYAYEHGWRSNGSGEHWAAGVRVQWDLWDGNRRRGEADEARAGLREAEEQERQVRLNIALQIEQARIARSEASERAAVAEKTVALAEESAALTRARFHQGLALSAQLIDSETALTAAQVRHAEALADERIALAALRKALGLPLLQ